MTAENNAVNWKAVIITVIFCLAAGLGGGLTIQTALSKYAAWVPIGYGVVAAIFTAIAALILMQVLQAFAKK
jgi:TRAP-type C4-dicarboxylate transport system permease small subunit